MENIDKKFWLLFQKVVLPMQDFQNEKIVKIHRTENT